ncbi:MAG: hypothetical protein WCP15_02405 [bacterium]
MNKKLAIIGAVIITAISTMKVPAVQLQTPPVPVVQTMQDLHELATMPRLVSWAAQNIDTAFLRIASDGIVGKEYIVWVDFTNGVTKAKLEALLASVTNINIVNPTCNVYVNMELISKKRGYFYAQLYTAPAWNSAGYWEIPNWCTLGLRLYDDVFIPYDGIEAAKIVALKSGSSTDWGSEDLSGRIERGQGFSFNTSRIGAGYLVVSTESGETIFNFSEGRYSLPVSVVMKLAVSDSDVIRFIDSKASKIDYKHYVFLDYDAEVGAWFGTIPLLILDAETPYKSLMVSVKTSAGYVQSYKVTRFDPNNGPVYTYMVFATLSNPTNGIYSATIDLTSPTLTHIEPIPPVPVLRKVIGGPKG